MQSILEQITDWLKSMIISGIMGNLSGMFDSVNQQVGQIAGDVGTTPANFSPAVFSMIRNISESVILPIAGMVLTFIACYELIQMLIEHNNLANFETWTFFKWVFKTFLAVTLISNTFNITMAVFDVAQQVISRSGGLISGSTSVSDATLTAMQATLEGMDLGPLLGLYLQTFVVQVTMLALSAIIFVIVYLMEYSCLKTIANKHKTSIRKIIRQYKDGKTWSVPYETKAGTKRVRPVKIADCKRGEASDIIYQRKKFSWKTTIRQRLNARVCELCGCKEADLYEVHVIRNLNELGNSDWETVMKKKRRKTLVVCSKCHERIHRH